MKFLRSVVASGMIVVLCACGTPPVRPDHLAEPEKRKLGRVAILVDSKDPVFEFDAAIKGKGDGGAKGAGEGAVASLQCGVLVIICLPLGLLAGAIVGERTASSSESMANTNARVQGEIHDLDIPGKTRGALSSYLKRVGVQSITVKLSAIAQPAPAKPDYSAMAGEADTVVEFGDFRLKAVTTGKADATLGLIVRAHVRVIRTANSQILDEFETAAFGETWPPEEWFARGAAGLTESMTNQTRDVAESAFDEALLIYHPAKMDPAKEKVPGPVGKATTAFADPPPQKELVPGYALRTVTPPFRNKIYMDNAKMNMGHLELYRLPDLQPTFEWEAFPRNYDIVPGNAAGQARNLRYDFRIYSRIAIAYEAVGLEAPRHKPGTPLQPCHAYRWTARATFELNGSPRVTEWTGGYYTIGGDVGPWEWRRSKKTSLVWLMPNHIKYPIVTTPASNGGPCPGD